MGNSLVLGRVKHSKKPQTTTVSELEPSLGFDQPILGSLTSFKSDLP